MKFIPTHDTPSGALRKPVLCYAYMLCEMIERFIPFLRVAGTCTSKNVHRGLLDWFYTSRTTLHAVKLCVMIKKRRNIILACFVPKNKFVWIIPENNVKKAKCSGT